MRCVVLGRNPGRCLSTCRRLATPNPTHRPRCSVLRELFKTTDLGSACQPDASVFLRLLFRSTATAQNVKTPGRLQIESRSPKLLVPFGLRLGMWCSGLGLGQSAPSIERRELLHRGQTLGLRSGLPSSPLITYPVGSGAKLCSCYSSRIPHNPSARNQDDPISTSFRHRPED